MAFGFDLLLDEEPEEDSFVDKLKPAEKPKLQPNAMEQKSAMRQFDQPIPGQSLTGEMGSAPYEQPPKYTDLQEFMTYMFESISRKDVQRDLLRMLDAGVPVNMLTAPILMQAMSEGKVNPDLAMLATQPLVTLLAGFGKKAGINVVVRKKEDDGLDPRPIREAFKDKRKEAEPAELPDEINLVSRRT